MARLNRHPFLVGTALLAALAGACCAHPEVVREWALAFWNLPAQQSLLEQERQRERELTVRYSESERRVAVKEQVTAELIAGRRTVPEAVARFRSVLESTPVALALLRRHSPGLSEEECIGRNVIHYAAVELADAPAEERAAVLHRLEQELRAHLAGCGGEPRP